MVSNKLKLIALLLLCAAGAGAQSFSFSDLIGQGGKDIKNMQAQLTALIALEKSTRQCYAMLKGEWSLIANWKNGELSLHQGYYTSLTRVNPEVKASTDLNSVQTEQQSIVSQFSSIQNLPGLSANEQNYVQAVNQAVLAELNKNLSDLQSVTTSGKLIMSDDERIQRVRRLTTAIKEAYLFTCNFCHNVKVLAAQRSQENNEVQTFNNVYENH